MELMHKDFVKLPMELMLIDIHGTSNYPETLTITKERVSLIVSKNEEIDPK